MVKLYELRINNFLEIELPPTGKRKLKRIKEIKQAEVLLGDTWYQLENLIPVRITESILLKCGFTKFEWVTEANVFEHGDINCLLDVNGLQVFGADFNNLKPLKYLHELQNLYYDLTEEELEVDFKEDYHEEEIFRKEETRILLSSNA
jgi:hypothetical protein